jgi:hypothetical protein
MKRDPRRNPLFDRRELLRLGALGAAGLAGLGAMDRALGKCVTTPSETEGPFWVDEMLNRSDIRADPTSGAVQAGVPVRLSINVSECGIRPGGPARRPAAGADSCSPWRWCCR